MTGQQLKNSILQMAVQGKLVPQDPNDEPASVLLERIRAEKEQLIKEGKIKKEKNPSIIFRGADNLPYEKIGKNEPVCIADDVPFEIPESWEWVTLKMIAITELGKTLDKAKNQGDYKPYLCSINVYWSGIDLTKVKEARFEKNEISKYKLKKGDLLICEGGDVGRSAIWENDQEMYYQNALHRVRFYGGINPYYFRLLMECYKGNKILDKKSKGMTIKHLVQTALNAIYFPLPPIQEQQRIVDKFQSLIPILEQYNTSEIRLSNLNIGFPDLLKKSILQEAVQGKLVPQDLADEPASLLLERIRAEKQKLIAEGKIKKDKHESVIFRRDNSHYEKLDEIERCIDDEIPFEIPESWEWTRLGQVISLLSGTDFKPEEYNDKCKGIPYITGASNLSDNGVLINRWTETPKIIANHGDVLLVCKGSGYGKTVICDIEKAHIARQLMAIKKFSTLDMLYIRLFLQANFDQIKSKGQGVIPGIDRSSVMNMLFPIPPLTEQKRIVEKQRELFDKISLI